MIKHLFVCTVSSTLKDNLDEPQRNTKPSFCPLNCCLLVSSTCFQRCVCSNTYFSAVHFPYIDINNPHPSLCNNNPSLSSTKLDVISFVLFPHMHFIISFHRANWHSPATLTEGFPCFFLSCKANARV